MELLKSNRIRMVGVALAIVVLLGASDVVAEVRVGQPVPLGPPVYSDFMDGDACLSADGQTLYLASDRPADSDTPYSGYWGIFVARRQASGSAWGLPTDIGLNINTLWRDETNPCISSDELELYFNRGWDIFVATRDSASGMWGPASDLGALVNAPGINTEPCISPDGFSLYFASNRDGGEGGMDLYVATRRSKRDGWDTVTNLGPAINSPGNEGEPSMTADGLSLIFESDRLGDCDLYATTRSAASEPWREPVCLYAGDVVETSGACISPDGGTLYFNRQIDVGIQAICTAQITPAVDLCCNGKVDLEDMVLILEGWGPCASSCDIGPMPWGDGRVDNADIDVLVSYWGQMVGAAGYWKLDETEGQIACDSSECCHDALVEGNPRWCPNGGMVDGALQFDGVDDCIEVPIILDPAAGPFSVFAKVLGGAPGEVIFCQDCGDKWLVLAEGGCLATELGTTYPENPLVSDAHINDGNWHCVGLTWDGTTRTLYVDGVKVARDTRPALASETGWFYIGAAGPENRRRAETFFSGMIDDVCIYDRAVKP